MRSFNLSCATPVDSELIRKLASQVWYETYGEIHSREQLEYMFEKMYHPDSLRQQMSEGHVFFIGYEAQIPIGYFSVEQKSEDLFYLQKLYVLPHYQGTGAGKYLFLAAVHYIKGIHPDKAVLELNVNRQNKAIRFYKKMGMNIYAESDEEIGEGFVMNNCFMRMQI